MKSNRVGLSEYTARRLAELRARRAEADDTGGLTVPPPSESSSSVSGSLTSSSSRLHTPSVNALSSDAVASSGSVSVASASSTDGAANSLATSLLQNGSSDKYDHQTNSSLSSSAVEYKYANSSSGFSGSTQLDGNSLGSLDNVHSPQTCGQVRKTMEVSHHVTSVKDQNNQRYSSSAASTGFEEAQQKHQQQTEAQCIGFSNLPEQLHRKAIKKGFDFTVMVVGETGLGKSTVISNLFCKYDMYDDRKPPELAVTKTVTIEKRFVEIEDHGIKLRLTIVDTPGFSDSIDTTECWKPISNYIDQQFERYYSDETGLNRHNIKDTRVHCCLYFISPSGHGLRPVDVQVMKNLQTKVNVVPVIAKADTLTVSEMKRLKSTVLSEIKKYNLHLYELPQCDDDEDESFRLKDREMKEAWPFAVVGANSAFEVGGRRVRGRVYPWGVVEADNPIHSDFTKLQQLLISTHLHDLKDVTCDVHYENFRVRCIRQQQNPSQQHDSVSPVSPNADDTEKLLRQKEEQIQRMQQMMVQMQSQLSSTRSRNHQQQHRLPVDS